MNIPVSIKDKYVARGYGNFTEVSCEGFCNCRWREKHKSKIANQFTPTHIVVETLVNNNDTCSKLNVGRVIIFRETTDSIITKELISKRP